MIDLQRRHLLTNARNDRKRHLPVTGCRLQINRIERLQRGLQHGIGFKNDAVLVGVGVDRRHDPLAKGIVQCIVDRGWRNAEASGGVAVDVDIGDEPLRCEIARDVGELRQLAELVHELRGPFGKLGGIGVLQHELVLGLADRIVDREVLHRLHIERDAGDRLGRCGQATDDLADVGAAPFDGERIRGKLRFTLAVLSWPWSAATWPSYCLTSAACVSSCCCGMAFVFANLW
jgi:hypothetical protein